MPIKINQIYKEEQSQETIRGILIFTRNID